MNPHQTFSHSLQFTTLQLHPFFLKIIIQPFPWLHEPSSNFYTIGDDNIITRGIPAIVMNCNKDSTSTHTPADKIFSKFGIFQDISLELKGTGHCYVHQSEIKAIVDNEAEVRRHVNYVLNDLLHALRLNLNYSLKPEKQMFGLVTDFFFIKNDDYIAVGVVEVKKNLDGGNERKISGQMFDYLMLLRFMGCKYPLGILTNYNQWGLCWLGESDKIAKCDNPSKLESIISSDDASDISLTDRIKSMNIDDDDDFSLSPTETKRSFFYEEHSYDNSSTVKALSTIIIKMTKVPVTKSILLCKSLEYMKLGKKENAWEKVKWECDTLNLYRMPNSGSDLYFFDDLGGQTDGRAVLAVDIHGHCCVIKFIVKGSAEEETKFWKTINKHLFDDTEETLYVAQSELLAKSCVIMPYCEILNELDVEQQILAAESIARMINEGWTQDDAKINHIGFTQLNGTTLATIIDFGHMKKVTEDKKVEAMRQAMQKFEITSEDVIEYGISLVTNNSSGTKYSLFPFLIIYLN
jgi:hypothetical protein